MEKLPAVSGPFRRDARFVARTPGSEVFKYDQPPAVIKLPTPEGAGNYNSVQEALKDAARLRKIRSELAEEIKKKGGSPETLPDTGFVIHNRPREEGGGIELTRWQTYIEGVRPMAGVSLPEFLSLPDSTLKHLRDIIAASLDFSPAVDLDLIGTHPPERQLHPRNVPQKPFSVLSSENIILDRHDMPQLIDIEDTRRWHKGGINIRRIANRLRSRLSLGLIDTVMTVRKIGKLVNRT